MCSPERNHTCISRNECLLVLSCNEKYKYKTYLCLSHKELCGKPAFTFVSSDVERVWTKTKVVVLFYKTYYKL